MDFNLINVSENYTNSLSYNYVSILSIVSIVLTISVIVAKNPIFSVLFLIGLFVTFSLLLIILGMKFIGIAYLLVYVGAISILFLFILMLINIRVSELLTEGNSSAILAIIALILLNSGINIIIPFNAYIVDFWYDAINLQDNSYVGNVVFNASDLINEKRTEYNLSNVTIYHWDNALIESTHITSVGNILYSNLLVFIILIGVILLLAMVGAIIITMKL